MKSRSLPFLVALVSVSLLGCGGDADTDAPESDPGDPPATAPAEEAQMGQGEETDLDAFLTEYEEFVDQYCEFTEEFSTANMTEMASLMEEMSAKSMELADYSTQVVALQASASPEAQRRLEEMQKKADGCSEALSG